MQKEDIKSKNKIKQKKLLILIRVTKENTKDIIQIGHKNS